MKKMISSLALIFALLGPSAQSAQAGVFKNTMLTPYQELGDWFAAGTPLAYEDFSPDYHIGRCFNVSRQSRPEAAMTASVEIRHGDDNGPGFPPAVEKKIFLFNSYANAAPDVFDRFPRLTNGRDGRVEFREAAAANWRFHSEVSEVGDTLTNYFDMEPNGRPDDRIQLVQGTEYIVSERTNLISQWRGDHFALEGEVLQRCYFFRRVVK